jgi:hypothetical protein
VHEVQLLGSGAADESNACSPAEIFPNAIMAAPFSSSGLFVRNFARCQIDNGFTEQSGVEDSGRVFFHRKCAGD